MGTFFAAFEIDPSSCMALRSLILFSSKKGVSAENSVSDEENSTGSPYIFRYITGASKKTEINLVGNNIAIYLNI